MTREGEPVAGGRPSSAPAHVLTLNAGSSSLKAALYDAHDPKVALVRESAERIGAGGPVDHEAALASVLAKLAPFGGLGAVTAVGHRVVHGGARYDGPARVDDALVAELRRLAPLDPQHSPAAIALIDALRKCAPETPQVACFDTAFHRTMPRVARMLALPHQYADAGVERFGFHGLSCTFLLRELRHVAGDEAARGRLVLAHLGSGASLTAVREGRSVDTTMGFTPTGGIPMGTRAGDLDPGVIVHLLRTEHLDADALDDLVNRRSGLVGVSGTSSDMRDLLAREAQDSRAADAVALFCHAAKKAIGALAAVLGGVDTLVFTAGVGERSSVVRARIVQGLEHLGMELDPDRNDHHAPVISTPRSACTLRVIHTDEELVIALETRQALGGTP